MDAMDMNRNVQLDHLEGHVMRMDPQRARRVLGYCPNCRQASVKVRAPAWKPAALHSPCTVVAAEPTRQKGKKNADTKKIQGLKPNPTIYSQHKRDSVKEISTIVRDRASLR